MGRSFLGPQFVSGSGLAFIWSYSADGASSKSYFPTTRAVVFWPRLFPQRLSIEKQFDLFAIAVNLDGLFMRLQVLRRPVREENLRPPFVNRIVSGIGGR